MTTYSSDTLKSIRVLKKKSINRKYSDLLILMEKFKDVTFFQNFINHDLKKQVFEILHYLTYEDYD